MSAGTWNDKSVVWYVLDALIRARTHMSYHQIEESVNSNPDEYYAEENTMRVQICYAIRKGLMKNIGQHECPSCFCSKDHYAVTDEGKTFHNERR